MDPPSTPRNCLLLLVAAFCIVAPTGALAGDSSSRLVLDNAADWILQEIRINTSAAGSQLGIRADIRYPLDGSPPVFALPGFTTNWLRLGSLQLSTAWRDLVYPLPFSFLPAGSPANPGLLQFADFSVEKKGLHLRLPAGEGAASADFAVLQTGDLDILLLAADIALHEAGRLRVALEPWLLAADDWTAGFRITGGLSGRDGLFELGLAPGFAEGSGAFWNSLWFEVSAPRRSVVALFWYQFLAEPAVDGPGAALQQEFGLTGSARLGQLDFEFRGAAGLYNEANLPPENPRWALCGKLVVAPSPLGFKVQVEVAGLGEDCVSSAIAGLYIRSRHFSAGAELVLKNMDSFFGSKLDATIDLDVDLKSGGDLSLGLSGDARLDLPFEGMPTFGFSLGAGLAHTTKERSIGLSVELGTRRQLDVEVFRGLNLLAATKFASVFGITVELEVKF